MSKDTGGKMPKEGWGYLETYSWWGGDWEPPSRSHYFIPVDTGAEEWCEEDGYSPLCGQYFNWEAYGLFIESNNKPQCKKCLKALEKRRREESLTMHPHGNNIRHGI